MSDTQLDIQLDDRADLRQFLQDRFDLRELKNVCFDLGIDYELFPHATKGEMTRELLSYFERQGKVACLIGELLRQRPAQWLSELLARLPSCRPNQKVQIILSADQIRDKPDLRQQLAALLGVESSEVMLIGTAPGSVQLLVGLPEVALDQLVALAPSVVAEYPVQSVTPFTALSLTEQERWRERVIGRPPPAAALTGGGASLVITLLRYAAVLALAGVVVAGAGLILVAVATPRLAVTNQCDFGIDVSYEAGFLGDIGVVIPNDGQPVQYRVPPGDYTLLLDEETITVQTPLLTVGPIALEGELDARFDEVEIGVTDQPVAVRVGLGTSHLIELCPSGQDG